MKSIHPNISISLLCELLGQTRQNFYKLRKAETIREEQRGIILDLVLQIRKDQHKIGTRKLQFLLSDELEGRGIKMGRDRWYKLLGEHNLLVKQTKKYRPKMTDGNGQSIYPDIRKTLVVTGPNQLWSADITYIELTTVGTRHCYATIVIDEYSHLIVGYSVTERMRTEDVVAALQMAVYQQAKSPYEFDHKLIFHSDRGSQFKSIDFRKYLNDYQIKQSMTQDGMSYENPVSERINGIIKNELLQEKSFDSVVHARLAIKKAVDIYNTKRPHLSCNMMTPKQAHGKNGPLKKLWRPRKTKKSKLT